MKHGPNFKYKHELAEELERERQARALAEAQRDILKDCQIEGLARSYSDGHPHLRATN